VREAGKRGRGDAGKSTAEGAQDAPSSHSALIANPLAGQPVEFVGSFPDPKVRVEPQLPEIAFIGRSNVGKSTLLNALLGRPGLARVSGSPGKTTLLNFYRLPGLYLVDLPGYGFARASKSERAGFRALLRGYLRMRETLAGVVWLLDIRHEPSREDREMQELLADSGHPVLSVFTKADKLNRAALLKRQRELAEELGLDLDHVAVTSGRSGAGIPDLAESVLAAAGGARR